MSRNLFAAVVVLGAFLLAFAGISQAGGWMHKSSGDARKVEGATEAKSPEFGDWDYFGAVEAGTLPGTKVETAPSETMNVHPIRWAEPFAKPLIGGLEFRTIDLGP